MNTPEMPQQGEAIATPEAHYSEQIKNGLAALTELQQLVLRNQADPSKFDAAKDALHALLDEAVEQVAWRAEKLEFGDMDAERFQRSQ